MDRQAIIIDELDSIINAFSINCALTELNKHLPPSNPDFSFIMQNIRSVHKGSNIDDLEINLNMLNINIDLIVLTECRINSQKPLPLKPNYSTYSSTNKTNQNDGVVVFMNNRIKHTVKEVQLSGASCLEVFTQNAIIICIYRSPSERNPNTFIQSLDIYLNKKQLKTNTIVAGDININIIDGNKDRFSSTYLDMLAAHNLFSGHRYDTRTNSCLDHIFTNLDIHKFTPLVAVLDTTITDHKMVLMYIYQKTPSQVPNFKNRKTKIITNYSQALQALLDINTEDLLNLRDPNKLCHILINVITECLIKSTKTINIPANKRIIKPWITPGMLKCIKQRNKLQRQLKRDETNDILRITYRRYRNFCNNLIKKQKKKYERELLNRSKKDNKTLWNCLKTLTHLNKQKSNNNELINLQCTPHKSADFINKYFNNIGKNLADKIIINPHSLNKYFTSFPTQVNSIGIIDPDTTEIESIISSLKSESSAGWDKIPTKFIKMAKKQLVPILTHLSVLCFQQGIFPSELKLSVIHPIFKSGDRDNINNYRPIAILTVISKIIEKIINNRLLNFLNSYKLLSTSQYGFRKGTSTEDAILDLTSDITKYLDNKQRTLCIFLDIKKAFDTVSIPTLTRKLEKIGVRGNFYALLSDYLNNRTQRVKLDKDTYSSDENTSNFGVPQGSVLGPTLFLTYINDLTTLNIKNGKFFSYADDTAILFHGKDWSEVYNLAELGLQKVINWLNIHSLSLNTSKTNFIAFSIRDSLQPDPNLSITPHFCQNTDSNICNCLKLEKVNNTKYLGIMLDKNLSWYPQIELVANRARKLIWIFKYLRCIADRELINYIYITLVQSILLYCISVWGGTYKSEFLSIERAQRTILKTMYKKKRSFSTNSLYNEANVLTVRQLFVLQCILKTHKNITSDPKMLKKRNQNSVVLNKKTNTVFASKQFCTQSTKIYNKINGILKIYSMSYIDCKKTVSSWLKSLNYQETEDLLL